VTESERTRSITEQRGRRARNGGCHIGSESEESSIVIGETKSSLRFSYAHSLLEECVVIDGRRRYLLVGPAIKYGHRCVFDSATKPRLITDVVTHYGWDSREVHLCSGAPY